MKGLMLSTTLVVVIYLVEFGQTLLTLTTKFALILSFPAWAR